MKIIRAETVATKRGAADGFTGRVWQHPIIEAPAPARIRALRVTFEPGARTWWHTQPHGQTLHVIEGDGRVQVKGEPVREIRPGDTVWIEPHVMHWHGAAPDQLMVHLAMQEAENGVSVGWGPEVSDADYAGKVE